MKRYIAMCTNKPTEPLRFCYSPIKKIITYHPSNSKEGIAIKGTNIRISIEYK